jgi:hypothetical protein
MIEAETILMATGLLELPTATHVRAAGGLLADLGKQMVEALDREDPGHLYIAPERASYFDRLSNPPRYEQMDLLLEHLVGHEIADAYKVLHGNARQTLLQLRPSSTIDTILGPKVLPLDSISAGRWALEVDVIEGLRLMKDVAAGALLKEAVDLFSACFPQAYAQLLEQLDVELAKRAAAKQSWEPPMWLADSLLVLEKRPFGAQLELTGPKPPPTPPAPKRGKAAELDTEGLKPKSQGG